MASEMNRYKREHSHKGITTTTKKNHNRTNTPFKTQSMRMWHFTTCVHKRYRQTLYIHVSGTMQQQQQIEKDKARDGNTSRGAEAIKHAMPIPI